MKKYVACALVLLLANPAFAKKKKAPKDDDSADDSSEEDSSDKKKPTKDSGDDQPSSDDNSDNSSDDDKPKKKAENEDFKKQDLNGHDLGTNKKENLFEKDRFFVDKVDSKKTENATLIQGSLASTSFLYTESGGALPGNATAGVNLGSDASTYSRLFTELRLQTDFRHIKGGKWDARVDVRGRVVDQPTANSGTLPGTLESTTPHIQSGLTGGNELDIKELWIVRNGKQSDVFIGRQFISDLAGVKIDGLRIDYASSSKFTILGFGGLFPLRGSRSITTDYAPLNFIDSNGNRNAEGRFVGTAGGGAAYRTAAAYGAFGGVVQAPFGGEQPRIFGTSNGYWRYGSTLDFYHFAVVDLVGSNAVNTGLTNLSLGVNYKPSPRLRITGSFNRVDTETLSVQAGAFLNSADTANPVLDNEVFLQRLATNELRSSVSAGLGQLQRFEVTTSLSFRYRPDVTLTSVGTATPVTATLKAEEGVEFYASFTDRRSIANLRLGADFLQTFGVGGSTYAHTNLFALRAFAGRELANGHGEWEAEVSYTQTKDNNAGGMATCSITTLDGCTGSAAGTLLSIGGSLYYRLNRDWFGMASAYITQQSIQTTGTGMTLTDPTVTGLSGFLRIAYRF